MKGLFIKDLKLMKNQARFLVVILLMSAVFSGMYANPFFAISYAACLISLFTLTTISYDEFDNGLAYLMTLPVSRRDYVREKYLFGILSTIAALVFAGFISLGVSAARDVEYAVSEWAGVMAGSALIVLVVISFMVPLQLKFKAEQSRIAMLLVIGGILVVSFIGGKVAEMMGIDVGAVVNRLLHAEAVKLFIGAAAAGALLLCISYFASLKIMEGKEF